MFVQEMRKLGGKSSDQRMAWFLKVRNLEKTIGC